MFSHGDSPRRTAERLSTSYGVQQMTLLRAESTPRCRHAEPAEPRQPTARHLYRYAAEDQFEQELSQEPPDHRGVIGALT